MKVPGRLRMCTVALVVGVASQTPAQQALRSADDTSHCSAEMTAILAHAGWPSAPGRTFTCSAMDGDPGDQSVRVTVRDRTPRPGEPCADLGFDRVAFATSSDGVTASFALFDGRSHGTVRLSPEQAAMSNTQAAYAVDALVGTYEGLAGNETSRLVCSLNPTYHFDCPTTHQLDQLCLVWVRRQPLETDG
jgi:hypothetical protein